MSMLKLIRNTCFLGILAVAAMGPVDTRAQATVNSCPTCGGCECCNCSGCSKSWTGSCKCTGCETTVE